MFLVLRVQHAYNKGNLQLRLLTVFSSYLELRPLPPPRALEEEG